MARPCWRHWGKGFWGTEEREDVGVCSPDELEVQGIWGLSLYFTPQPHEQPHLETHSSTN
jgi:hypothetical protein